MEDQPGPEGSRPKGWFDKLPDLGIGGVVKIVLAALSGSPPWLRGFLVIAGLVAVVCLILNFTFAARPGNELYAVLSGAGSFILLLFTLFALTAVTVVYLLHSGAPSPPDSAAPVRLTEPKWSRLVPMLPIAEDDLQNLADRLGQICNKAYAEIRQMFPDGSPIEPRHVRANVFLPDTRDASIDGVCELYIPKRLHCGMTASGKGDEDRAEKERNIRFWPNQGLTGVVFIEQQPSVARVEPVGRSRYAWPGKYHLTEAQKEAIHPDLKWIIAFPLNVLDGQRPKAMGVLNVDGIVHQLEEPMLHTLIGKLFMDAAAFTLLFAKVKRSRISVYVEEVPDV